MIVLRTHPTVVRAVLADMEAGASGNATARRHGVHTKTVRRWVAARAVDPSWPTDELTRDWVAKEVATADRRRVKAAAKREYVKRCYVARGPMHIDSLGSTRRMQALYAIGWTSTHLGQRLGVSSARVGHLTTGVRTKIHRDTAARIAALYDELSMVVPQDPDVMPFPYCRVHDRQRRQSRAKGWVPPLGWENIDDPDEEPTGWEYVPPTRAELLTDLVESGASISTACTRLGLNRAALQKWCGNQGLHDLFHTLASREFQPVVNQHTRAAS